MALDDVKKISLSALNDANMLSKKAQEKEETKKSDEQSAEAQVNHKNPKEILDAMELSGSQNKMILGLNMVDPTKYLSPERIKDIEESMGKFEAGVKKNLDVINQEFGGLEAGLSESYKLELAAQMML